MNYITLFNIFPWNNPKTIAQLPNVTFEEFPEIVKLQVRIARFHLFRLELHLSDVTRQLLWLSIRKFSRYLIQNLHLSLVTGKFNLFLTRIQAINTYPLNL